MRLYLCHARSSRTRAESPASRHGISHCRATAVRDITAAHDAASGYLAPALRHPRILQGVLTATLSLPEILKCRPAGAGFQGIRPCNGTGPADKCVRQRGSCNTCGACTDLLSAVPRTDSRMLDQDTCGGGGVRVTPPYRAVLCSHHGSCMSTDMWSGCSCSLCIRSVCGPHMRRRSLLALRTL